MNTKSNYEHIFKSSTCTCEHEPDERNESEALHVVLNENQNRVKYKRTLQVLRQVLKQHIHNCIKGNTFSLQQISGKKSDGSTTIRHGLFFLFEETAIALGPRLMAAAADFFSAN